MLAVLAAFGSGLASLLPRTTDASTRWGFAPVLGLSLGAAVFTTVEWVLPARRSSWLIGLLCGVSLAIAWLRRRRAPLREDTGRGRLDGRPEAGCHRCPVRVGDHRCHRTGDLPPGQPRLGRSGRLPGRRRAGIRRHDRRNATRLASPCPSAVWNERLHIEHRPALLDRSGAAESSNSTSMRSTPTWPH